MSTPTIIYLALWWFGTGCFSFWFWLTREYEFRHGFVDYLVMFVSGFSGIITWFICWIYFKGLGYNIYGIKE